MKRAVKEQMNRPQIIHSGHFMVSEPHADPDPTLTGLQVQKQGAAVLGSAGGYDGTIGIPDLSREGYDFDTVNKQACQTYRFGPRSTGYLNIDASLTKLFECMTLAYSGRIVSPKWKTFKGLKLLWRDKIRLNNAIWRAWYLQYVEKLKNPVCNFVTPLEGLETEEHRKPESVVIEGKYWKRRIEIVIREYHIWRTYFRNQLRNKKSDEDLSQLLQEECAWPIRAVESATACPMDSDPFCDVDTLMMEFSDTLFSTLAHHPCAWPSSKSIAYLGNADMIQPSLTPLQPNMGDDFMDTFDPLQEYFTSSHPVNGNCNFSGLTGNIFSAGAPIIPAVTTLGTSGQTQQSTSVPDSAVSLGVYTTAFGVVEQTEMPSDVPQNVPCAKAVSPLLSPVVFGMDFGTTASFQENPSFLPLFPPSRVENDTELHIQKSKTTTSNITVNFPSPAPLLPSSDRTSSCSNFDCSQINHCSSVVQSSVVVPQKNTSQLMLPQQAKSFRPFVVPKSDVLGVGGKTKQLQRIAPATNTSLTQSLISSGTPVRTQNTFLAQLLMSAAPTGPFATLQHHFSRPEKSPPSCKQMSGMTSFHGGILIGAAQQAGVISESPLPFTPGGVTELKLEDVLKQEKSCMPQSSDLLLQDYKNKKTSPFLSFWKAPEVEPEESPKKHTVDLSAKSNRRSSHVSAEHVRRCNINLGFTTLASLVLPLHSQPTLKNISKAALLQKTAEYIRWLQSERQQIQEEMARVRNEISELNSTINEYQQQLPSTGAPSARQHSSHLADMFDDYVRSRTLQNWRFWVFSIMVRPLFDSYTETTCTASLEDFCRTVLLWLEKHCSLPIFRKTVLNSLRQMSRTTSILSDPSLVPQQATQAVNRGRKSSMP